MNLGESMLTYHTEAREVPSLLGAGARHRRAITYTFFIYKKGQVTTNNECKKAFALGYPLAKAFLLVFINNVSTHNCLNHISRSDFFRSNSK